MCVVVRDPVCPPGANNAVARFILCCLKCCFWCLERFIRYMNRNAYIMVSLFCCDGGSRIAVAVVFYSF